MFKKDLGLCLPSTFIGTARKSLYFSVILCKGSKHLPLYSHFVFFFGISKEEERWLLNTFYTCHWPAAISLIVRKQNIIKYFSFPTILS